MFVCVFACICLCACVYLGSISSLKHISLNNVDIFCRHIFVYVLLIFRIDFMVSGANWLMKLP